MKTQALMKFNLTSGFLVSLNKINLKQINDNNEIPTDNNLAMFILLKLNMLCKAPKMVNMCMEIANVLE